MRGTSGVVPASCDGLVRVQHPSRAVFLAGFREAVRIAILLVAGCLLLNATEASMRASQAPLRAGLEPAG